MFYCTFTYQFIEFGTFRICVLFRTITLSVSNTKILKPNVSTLHPQPAEQQHLVLHKIDSEIDKMTYLYTCVVEMLFHENELNFSGFYNSGRTSIAFFILTNPPSKLHWKFWHTFNNTVCISNVTTYCNIFIHSLA